MRRVLQTHGHMKKVLIYYDPYNTALQTDMHISLQRIPIMMHHDKIHAQDIKQRI